ncbi:MAG: hypothetical protein ACR2OT_04300 [Parvibaculales bacterium]
MMARPTTTPEGICRRHAPHPILLDKTPYTNNDAGNGNGSGTSWPRTFEDDWCGEGEANTPA